MIFEIIWSNEIKLLQIQQSCCKLQSQAGLSLAWINSLQSWNIIQIITNAKELKQVLGQFLV